MKPQTLNIYIGFDSKEPSAWYVLAHSIHSRATVPVNLIPLNRRILEARGLYWRPRTGTESTEFSMTRFLVPYLSGFEGYSLFLDCDMLCRVDIGDIQLHLLADPGRAVYVCQHDYVPKGFFKSIEQLEAGRGQARELAE